NLTRCIPLTPSPRNSQSLYILPLHFLASLLITSVLPLLFTLSLHAALPIYPESVDNTIATEKPDACVVQFGGQTAIKLARHMDEDRKSTRLNSSHVSISYAVFCLKKKKTFVRLVLA